MRFLSCWLPNWPIQRIVIDQPDFRGLPLALYESGPRGGWRITFVSSAATKLGIEPGIPVADATARLGKKLCLAPADSIADGKRLIEIARRCEQFSPLIGLGGDLFEKNGGPIEATSDSLFFNLTGIGRLFGGEEKLAQQIQTAFRKWGYLARIAIAPNMGAAWAFSHFDARCRQNPLRIGCEQGKDGGSTDELLAQLKPLPLAALRLTDRTLRELFELGLEVIDDLLVLPRESISARFSDDLLKRLDQACGKHPESFQAVEPQEEFIVTWDFIYPTSKDAAIKTALGHLCDRLGDQLQAANRGALEIICNITCEPKAKLSQAIGFYRETSNPKHIFELLQLKFEQFRLPAPVASLSLKATRTSLLLPRQKEFFTDEWKDYSEEFSLLVNQLSGRLGEHQVVRPFLCSNAQPERAYREEPLLTSRRKRSNSSSPFTVLERPIQLLERPVSIQVISVFPDGPPSQFIWSGQSYQVHHEQGPERIETSWWGKRGIRRDYYRVETTCGAWFWIFRALENGKWFLHGNF